MVLQTKHSFSPATSAPVWPRLSGRETEVLTWIAHGKSNGAIATILGISVHTVDTLCRRVLMKFDTSSRTTAAVRASQAGLLGQI
ncbi:MAG: helix-turn-helix transcriptional regulator [Pseudomonadota bacterium]